MPGTFTQWLEEAGIFLSEQSVLYGSLVQEGIGLGSESFCRASHLVLHDDGVTTNTWHYTFHLQVSKATEEHKCTKPLATTARQGRGSLLPFYKHGVK